MDANTDGPTEIEKKFRIQSENKLLQWVENKC